MSDFLGAEELERLGLGSCGEGVRISRRAAILAPEHVHVGAGSRIDAFCLISANPRGVRIGAAVHLSAYVSIVGRESVVIGDFSSISVKASLFTSTDDFHGIGIANAMVPDELRVVTEGPIVLGEHAVVGASSVVLPGVTIRRSGTVGALTLVKEDVEEFAIVGGIPMRRIGTRSREHLEKARRFRPDPPVDR